MDQTFPAHQELCQTPYIKLTWRDTPSELLVCSVCKNLLKLLYGLDRSLSMVWFPGSTLFGKKKKPLSPFLSLWGSPKISLERIWGQDLLCVPDCFFFKIIWPFTSHQQAQGVSWGKGTLEWSLKAGILFSWAILNKLFNLSWLWLPIVLNCGGGGFEMNELGVSLWLLAFGSFPF